MPGGLLVGLLVGSLVGSLVGLLVGSLVGSLVELLVGLLAVLLVDSVFAGGFANCNQLVLFVPIGSMVDICCALCFILGWLIAAAK